MKDVKRVKDVKETAIVDCRNCNTFQPISSYDNALAREFESRGLRFARQVPVYTEYKGEVVGRPYRVDFVVEEELVVELKATAQPAAIHRAQLRTYLRSLHLRQGLLLNFNYPRLVDGMISVLLPVRDKDR